jgi:NitT/TauT family transport system substrate-binding protein
VEYPSASEVLRAFRNQAIGGMVISLDELFGLAADGFSQGSSWWWTCPMGDVVVGRSGMKTMRPQGQIGRGRKQRPGASC